MYWWKKYEPILEQKAVPAKEVLVDEMAKLLADALLHFPPAEADMDWSDATLERKLRGRLHELPKVDGELASLLEKILLWDLTHEVDAIDHLFRNDAHRAACPTDAHVDALHLLWRGLLEQLYQWKDDASGALKRRDLEAIVERGISRFRKRLLDVV